MAGIRLIIPKQTNAWRKPQCRACYSTAFITKTDECAELYIPFVL